METRKIAYGTARSAILSAAIMCCLGVLPTDDAFARTSQPRRPTGGSLLFVQNCNDSGPGSLRDTVATAISGDSIDLAQMGCSLISLSTGAIEVPQDDLTIKYSNTAGKPTISGEYLDRVFHHTGNGTLELGNLMIEQGKYEGTGNFSIGNGGCIYSKGNVTLNSSVVTHCDLDANQAYGGGLFVHGVATIYNSVVSYCHVQVRGNGPAYGGALNSGVAQISYSTLSHNVVDWPGAGAGFASRNIFEAPIAEPVSVDHTLIAYNEAYNNAAATIYNYGLGVVFSDVTIIGNVAGTEGGYTGTNGGIRIYDNSDFHNVTLVGNHSNASPSALWVSSTTLVSTIIADNTTPFSDSHQLSGSIGGDHDLVFGPAGEALPPGTLMVDPLLLPLTDNGGKTLTMALRADSPAIDAGADTDDLLTDQRGPGFDRSVGGGVDLGAFERQGQNDGDYISVGGFDPP